MSDVCKFGFALTQEIQICYKIPFSLSQEFADFEVTGCLGNPFLGAAAPVSKIWDLQEDFPRLVSAEEVGSEPGPG